MFAVRLKGVSDAINEGRIRGQEFFFRPAVPDRPTIRRSSSASSADVRESRALGRHLTRHRAGARGRGRLDRRSDLRRSSPAGADEAMARTDGGGRLNGVVGTRVPDRRNPCEERPLIATVIGDPSGIGPEVCVKALPRHPAGGCPNATRRQPARAGGIREDLRHRSPIRFGRASGGCRPRRSHIGARSRKSFLVRLRGGPNSRVTIVQCSSGSGSLAASPNSAGWPDGSLRPSTIRRCGRERRCGEPRTRSPPALFSFGSAGRFAWCRSASTSGCARFAQWVKQVASCSSLAWSTNRSNAGEFRRPALRSPDSILMRCSRRTRRRSSRRSREARRVGIDAIGPVSPDAVFRQAREGVFDAVVTMYHDQGQIALKTAAFAGACTVFLGLPYVRIGIPHGTAYDIAGTGKAQHLTMLAAMRTAAALSSGRGFPLAFRSIADNGSRRRAWRKYWTRPDPLSRSCDA